MIVMFRTGMHGVVATIAGQRYDVNRANAWVYALIVGGVILALGLLFFARAMSFLFFFVVLAIAVLAAGSLIAIFWDDFSQLYGPKVHTLLNRGG